ncbi:MAG: glycosyltransferase [Candidatus Bathyarchaeota archaeon]|nr:glycosyltransferase [Candidatus Bathyarchaeota archaeon]
MVTTTWNERKNVAAFVAAVRFALREYPHEVIVVDDDSSDGTFEVAKRFADVAVKKAREGQAKGLLYGMQLAQFPVVVTIDADLENDPKHIPHMLDLLREFDVVVASRTEIPRFSEKLASKTLGKLFGVTDSFSNFRAFRKEAVACFRLRGGETFGAEFLVIAKKHGLSIGELRYVPPPRRQNPRIGGTLKANVRILWALLKSFILYLF